MGESGLMECLTFMVLLLFVCWIADNEGIGVDGARHIEYGLEKNTSLTRFRLSLLTLYSTMKTNKTLAIFRQ
jgi:hypothetical protein